jgi:hypothetical protein
MYSKASMNLLRKSMIALAISQLFSAHAWADTEAQRIADLEKKLEQSLQQIQLLSSRLEKLEKPGSAPVAAAASGAASSVATAPTAAAADTQARIDVLERSLTQITDAAGHAPSNQGVPLHGFADVGYVYSGKGVTDGRKSGFALGNVDFYLTPEFGDSVKSLIELNFEYGSAGALQTDLERLQIGYTVSDALTIWAGRFHTPYGYWNTAYHHGGQIQTAILRPKVVAFEDQGGFLPSHTVGLWLTGQWKFDGGKLEYDAYVGNGDRITDRVLDFNPLKDDNGNKIIGGSLRYRFGGAADGLVLGAHAFSEKVNAYNGDAIDTSSKVNLVGGYGFYDGNDWEIISEYYHFNNKDQLHDGGSRSSWSGFVQAGKTFGGKTTPYVRWEKAALAQDSYFASLDNGRSYKRQALGLRYEVNPKTALKFEVNRTDETPDGGQKYNEAQLQFAVRF